MVDSKPISASASRAARYRRSGWSPSVNRASVQPAAAPRRATSMASSTVRYGARTPPGVFAKVQ